MNRFQPRRRLRPLTRLGVLVASASLVIAPALQANPPAPPFAETGTIKGRLIYTAGPVPPIKLSVKKGDPKAKDPAVCAANDIVDKELVVDPATKGVGDVYAYLLKPTGNYAEVESSLLEKNPTVLIDQVGCEFTPYATVVHKDQKLIFSSSDPVGHNVRFQAFATGNKSMNNSIAPNGKIPYQAEKAERRPIPMFCDLHPWMKGYFLIVDHPFATVTKPDGSFEITGVPAGTQMLIVWQGATGYVNEGGNKGMKVEVKAGATTDVGDVKITKAPAAK